MSAGRSVGGLRDELTEFVGRRAELARVREALEGARLVTLTGPGGIGKTRLALQFPLARVVVVLSSVPDDAAT